MPRKIDAAPLAPDEVVVEVDEQGGEAVLGNDNAFHSPTNHLKAGPEAQSNQDLAAQLESLLSPAVLQNLIAAGVQAHFAAHPELAPAPEAPKQEPASTLINPNLGQAVPQNYLKAYRNSRSPEIEYLELDMSALDRGENPSMFPIKGSYLRFQRGRFYATTQNQVRQLDWLSKRDTVSGDGKAVIGGDPALYEDDGEQILYCPVGCSHAEYHFASTKSLGRHMRAVHHMNVFDDQE